MLQVNSLSPTKYMEKEMTSEYMEFNHIGPSRKNIVIDHKMMSPTLGIPKPSPI